MRCTKSGWIRFLDMVFMALVFLFQSVMLNYIIIWHNSSSIFSFLWFLGDFFCLVLFSFAVFLAHSYHRKVKLRERRSASRASYASNSGCGNVGSTNNRSGTPQGSETSEDSGFVVVNRMLGSTKLPLTYMSWLFYAFLLIMKITVLFKTDIAQKLPKDEVLGPQMLKFCIGLSTIVFSLLVESHHNALDDPLRNSYLNSVAFGVALEILDSVSFLSLLIPSEGHLSYTFNMENYVIALASFNLMLPAVNIYKLSASNFGRAYNVPLETVYKFLHLILVNAPYLALRIYLWRTFSTDTAIFMIKNIYAIIAFIRGIYPDIKLLRQLLQQRFQLRTVVPAPKDVSDDPGLPSQQPIPSTSKNCHGSNGHIPADVQVVYHSEQSSPECITARRAERHWPRKKGPSVSIEDSNNPSVNFR